MRHPLLEQLCVLVVERDARGLRPGETRTVAHDVVQQLPQVGCGGDGDGDFVERREARGFLADGVGHAVEGRGKLADLVP